MKKIKPIFGLIFLVVSIAISIYFIPWDLLGGLLKPLPRSVESEIESAVENSFDGIILYVNQSGEETLYSSGWNNRENRIEADPSSLFKIASISKLYIAAAAAKLIEEDQVSLENTLADLLPDYADRIANSEEITFKMLLQHRSGIPNFTDNPSYPWENLPKTNADTLNYALDLKADFKPNAKYKYSNTNYLLIGEILDKILGYSHHRYMDENLLEPLALKNTYNLQSEIDINDLMSGYYIGYPHDIKYNEFVAPGGSMVATATDVGRFLKALNTGTLLSRNEQEIYSSIYEYEHTGLLPGYQSIARYNSETDTVLVMFTNTSGDNAWQKFELLYNRVAKIINK